MDTLNAIYDMGTLNWNLLLMMPYFLMSNGFYLILLCAAALSFHKRVKKKKYLNSLIQHPAAEFFPISVIVPAHNEAESIVDSVQCALSLRYPTHEVIIVNDGSCDKTLNRLINMFKLEPITLSPTAELSKITPTQIYRSRVNSLLTVIDKKNGGKADAINVGIEYAQYGHFCVIDSDSILNEDALLQIATPFIEDPYTVAAGGLVRIGNGSNFKHGKMLRPAVPENFFALFQIVEYIRSFLCGRMGWDQLNATLLISGAFGLFHRSTVIQCGGYRTDCIGEDFELIVRMHRKLRNSPTPYRIQFVPEPVCWTQAPTDVFSVYQQRNRWQRGLLDVFCQNIDMLFNCRYGTIGLLAFPYLFLIEILGPFIELAFYVFFIIGLSMGLLNPQVLAICFAIGILGGCVLSVASFVLEERVFGTYRDWVSLHLLFLFSILENFGWRQWQTLIKLGAIWDFVRGRRGWGNIVRTGW